MKQRDITGKIAVLLLVLAASPLIAQSPGAAVVTYAYGDGFTLIRDETPEFYEIDYDPVLGMELLPGDMVQTEDGTFVEIQIQTSRSVLKIAENTTFRLDEVSGAGGGSFNIAYGRVRAKVNKLVGTDFSIEGRETVAGVRGTDFGYDLIYEQAGDNRVARTRVYCFEGSVEVSRPVVKESPETEAAAETEAAPAVAVERETVIIEANEMVELEEIVKQDESAAAAEPVVTPVLEKKPIVEEIEEFWTVEQPFVTEVAVTSEEKPMEIQPEAKPTLKETVQTNKPVAGLLGAVLLGGGGALGGYGVYTMVNPQGDTDIISGAMMTAGGVIVVSTAVYLFTLIFQ